MQEEDIINWQDLAPSDYHLFIRMKEGLWGKHYASDEKAKTAAMKWLKKQSTGFYKVEIHVLIQKCNIATERNNDYVEK